MTPLAAPTKLVDVVDLDDLSIDRTYQRKLDTAWVKARAAEGWDMVRAQVITLSRRDTGELWVIDGQHRVALARECGECELLAEVHIGLTPEEEADLFFQLQDKRKPMRPMDKWRASLRAKHPHTVEIDRIVTEVGGRVNVEYTADGGIKAVGMLWKIYGELGGRVLKDTLLAIKAAWPEENLRGLVVESSVLQGVAFVIGLHGKQIDGKRLARQLAKKGPIALRRLALTYKELGRKIGAAHYQAILDTYNKGLKENSRLEEQRPDWRVVRTKVRKEG